MWQQQHRENEHHFEKSVRRVLFWKTGFSNRYTQSLSSVPLLHIQVGFFFQQVGGWTNCVLHQIVRVLVFALLILYAPRVVDFITDASLAAQSEYWNLLSLSLCFVVYIVFVLYSVYKHTNVLTPLGIIFNCGLSVGEWNLFAQGLKLYGLGIRFYLSYKNLLSGK